MKRTEEDIKKRIGKIKADFGEDLSRANALVERAQVGLLNTLIMTVEQNMRLSNDVEELKDKLTNYTKSFKDDIEKLKNSVVYKDDVEKPKTELQKFKEKALDYVEKHGNKFREIINIDDCCKLLNVTRKDFDSKVRPELESQNRIGNQVFFTKSDVIDFLTRG